MTTQMRQQFPSPLNMTCFVSQRQPSDFATWMIHEIAGCHTKMHLDDIRDHLLDTHDNLLRGYELSQRNFNWGCKIAIETLRDGYGKQHLWRQDAFTILYDLQSMTRPGNPDRTAAPSLRR